jgi:hypothetical protein
MMIISQVAIHTHTHTHTHTHQYSVLNMSKSTVMKFSIIVTNIQCKTNEYTTL